MQENEKFGPVTLTQVAGSPCYYVRYRKNGKQQTRSLGTTDVDEAREKAQAYADTLGPVTRAPKVDHSYLRYARQTIEDDARKVKRGERSPSLVRDGEQILKTYCQRAFGSLDVRKIDYRVLKEFVDDLTDRDLKTSSIKKIMVHVSKALTTAAQLNVIQALPAMPKVDGKLGARGWFTKEEYRRLLAECRKHELAGTKVRSQVITKELRYFVTFMVNSFLRPGDAKLLQHRHIEVVRTPATKYLRITMETGKTTNAPVVTMPQAVDIYERLLKMQKANGYGAPDDYLFLPKHKARDFAIKELGRMFRAVLISAGLETARSGEPRSLYSLRHTAITFRLLRGNVDTVTLARAARTSAEMIDRFYASHLTAEMNIEKLQSMR